LGKGDLLGSEEEFWSLGEVHAEGQKLSGILNRSGWECKQKNEIFSNTSLTARANLM
jgi:hypothetical protein